MAGRMTYRDAGVDIEAGDRFARGIVGLMRHTFTPRVIENTGGFGSLFALDYDRKLLRRNYRRPVLVAGTDGVGTKLRIAFLTGRHNTVGIDLVALCVNDLLALVRDVTGRPPRLEHAATAPGDARDTWGDNSLARRVLGFRPRVDLAQGLATQWEWIKGEGPTGQG